MTSVTIIMDIIIFISNIITAMATNINGESRIGEGREEQDMRGKRRGEQDSIGEEGM